MWNKDPLGNKKLKGLRIAITFIISKVDINLSYIHNENPSRVKKYSLKTLFKSLPEDQQIRKEFNAS